MLERERQSVRSSLCEFSEHGDKLLWRGQPSRVINLTTGEISEIDDRQLRAGIEGFPKSARTAETEKEITAKVPEEILARFRAQIPDDALNVECTTNRQRLIVHHHNGEMAVWDIDSQKLLHRCYQFKQGRRWLTIQPDGQYFGALEFVR